MRGTCSDWPDFFHQRTHPCRKHPKVTTDWTRFETTGSGSSANARITLSCRYQQPGFARAAGRAYKHFTFTASPASSPRLHRSTPCANEDPENLKSRGAVRKSQEKIPQDGLVRDGMLSTELTLHTSLSLLQYPPRFNPSNHRLTAPVTPSKSPSPFGKSLVLIVSAQSTPSPLLSMYVRAPDVVPSL